MDWTRNRWAGYVELRFAEAYTNRGSKLFRKCFEKLDEYEKTVIDKPEGMSALKLELTKYLIANGEDEDFLAGFNADHQQLN